MTFYLISGPPRKAVTPKIPTLIERACASRGIGFELLDIRTVDPSNLPMPTAADAIYRSVMFKKARTMEKLMLNADCRHVYTDLFAGRVSRGGSYFFHRGTDVPIVPTVPYLPEANETLAAAAETLGGFPLIVKVTGGTLGVGVIRVDTMLGLQSLADYLRSTNADIYLRKYIEHEYYVRAVVLDDQVIASHKTYALAGEFRTNVGDSDAQRREPTELPEELQKTIVDAVRMLGLRFAGVDVLFDADGTPYITEVNYPFDFACTQDVTGIDIAGALVDALQGGAN